MILRSNYKKLFLVLDFFLITLSLYLLQSRVGYADSNSYSFSARPEQNIQISLSGGTNQYGKKTVFQGRTLNFGKVSFIHPEQISNGDAYLYNGNLRLEAIVNVDVIFNGATSVSLHLSKYRDSTSPFHNSYFSSSVDRAHSLEKIDEQPLSNLINTINSAKTTAFRLVLEISPQQTGKLTNRFLLEARSL